MHKSKIIGRDYVNSNLYVKNDKIFVSKSPYSAYEETEEDELVYRGTKGYVKTEYLLLEVQTGNLRINQDDKLDLNILLSLDELEFGTSRMITMYLNLIGIYVNQKKVHNRLKYLNKLKVISSYEFMSKSDDGGTKTSNAPIYCLDIGSVPLFKSAEIKSKFNSMKAIENASKPIGKIKAILARNQLMLTFVLEIKNIEYTKNNPTYILPNGEKLIPELQIVFNYGNTKHHMLFEFIRSFKGWENNLLDKIQDYKQFIENFKPSNSIPGQPMITLVAEDDKHAHNIFKLISKNDLLIPNYSYLFTTDTRVITQGIQQTLFTFIINNESTKIQVLNTNLFEI